jgi:hypothetical protein
MKNRKRRDMNMVFAAAVFSAFAAAATAHPCAKVQEKAIQP